MGMNMAVNLILLVKYTNSILDILRYQFFFLVIVNQVPLKKHGLVSNQPVYHLSHSWKACLPDPPNSDDFYQNRIDQQNNEGYFRFV